MKASSMDEMAKEIAREIELGNATEFDKVCGTLMKASAEICARLDKLIEQGEPELTTAEVCDALEEGRRDD